MVSLIKIRCEWVVDMRDLALIDGNTHKVSDSQLSSSIFANDHSHIHSRLITITGSGIWAGEDDVTDWIQVRYCTV